MRKAMCNTLVTITGVLIGEYLVLPAAGASYDGKRELENAFKLGGRPSA